MDRALVLALGFFTIECNSEAIAREVRRPPSHQRRQLRCQLQEEDHSNRGQFGIVARARGPTSLFWSSSLSGVGGSVSGPPFPLGLASEGREDVTCRRCNVTDGCRESMSKRNTFERRTGGGGAVPKCQWQDGMRAAGSALGRRKRRPLRTDTPRGGGSSYDSSSSDSSRSSSSSSRAAGKAGVPSVVLRLRGGDAPPSSSSPSKTKVDIKEEAPWSINLNVFGWGGENTEAKAEEKKKAQQIIEHAQARDVMRKAREERLERELEESGAGEEGEEVGEDKTAGGILVSMAKAGEPARQAASQGDKRLWLDAVEGFLGGVSLVITSLYPLWHTLRGMFGLSLLFYGQDFATLAFHIVVFRISGWKKAAKSKDDLVAYYKKARSTMSKAAKDVRASAAIIARQNKLVARKEEMMKEKKRLHAMGRVSAEEARAFIDKYRQEIDIIAQEQEILSETSSSVLAIKGALSFKKLAASVNSLYAAVITSITASTFKRAGQLTLALTCGGLIKRTLFDLLGPIIDPIGYQIELETYVANIMRGPANLYITLAGYMSSASVFFHFFVDPHQALTITFVLLGARVVTDYIVAALNPVRWRFGIQKKLDNMPLSAMIYLVLASLGFMFHGNAGIVGDYACKPFIAFLGVLNEWLNHFQATTISYFS